MLQIGTTTLVSLTHKTINVMPFRQVTGSTKMDRYELLLLLSLLLLFEQNNSDWSFSFRSNNSIP
jgi:hypothetical protein